MKVETYKTKMKKFLQKHDFYPVLLFLLCLSVFGLFIPFLGFYWDDFPYLWFRHAAGVSGVMQALALDRPLLAAVYWLPMSILGETPLAWQLAAILARWLFTWSMYAFLKNLWPDKLNEIKLITLLALVFPGFKQQWVSVIYTHVFIVFALYFFSLRLFISFIRKGERFSIHVLGAVLLSLICMTAVEYVAGLELLRPLIIFYLIAESSPASKLTQKLGQTFLYWLPYLLSFLVFLFYRGFVVKSVLYDVQQLDNLEANPFAALWDLVTQLLRNTYTSTVRVWAQIFSPLNSLDLTTLFSKVYLGCFLIILILSLLLIFKTHPIRKMDWRWAKNVVFGAICSLFFAGIPFWAANLVPGIGFPADRMLLPFLLGSVLLIFVIFYMLAKPRWLFSLLFSIFFAFSFAFQLNITNTFRNDWDDFKQFFRQVTWRIPSLEKNTLMVTDALPLQYYSDNSLTSVFNWIYSRSFQKDVESNTYSLPYLINYTQSRLGHSLANLDANTMINHNYRIFSFKGSTNRMIIFYHQPPGCVHIVDPKVDFYNPLLPAFLREYVQHSREDLIKSEKDQKEIFFITEESDDSWCYYYQKASLAAASSHWDEVVRLGEIAFNLDDYPNDASERVPFIKGYAHTGEWTKALELIWTTAQVSPLYKPMVCHLWQTLEQETSPSLEKEKVLDQFNSLMDCP